MHMLLFTKIQFFNKQKLILQILINCRSYAVLQLQLIFLDLFYYTTPTQFLHLNQTCVLGYTFNARLPCYGLNCNTYI